MVLLAVEAVGAAVVVLASGMMYEWFAHNMHTI